MPKPINLEGQKFSKLTVSKSRKTSKGKEWLCLCDCGQEKWVKTNLLTSGVTKSCGCLMNKHGLSKTKAWGSWRAMKERCENPNCKSYKNYGAKGITYCERWQSFANFYEDMGERPSEHTLERLDNSKGYSKANCVWIHKSKQGLNQTSNLVYTYQGKTMILAEWTRLLNLNYDLVYNRLRRGMSFEESITRPKGRWIK